MTLSSNDQTRIDQAHHDPGPLTINAVPAEIVATARINQASFSYALATLTVDNTSADWLTAGWVGRAVWIGTSPGAYDVTMGIVRKASTSNTLYIDPKQAGDAGIARDIQQALDDNQYVSILKHHLPFGLASSIRKGVFYKSWDLAYSDQGRRPRDLVNLGEHQQAWVDPDTGVARFTINVDVDYWTGNAYSAHTWGVDGQTVISSSAAQLVVDCEPGCHQITYALTNTNGKVTTAYRYLFANDPDTYPPLNHQYSITADSTQERGGVRTTLTVNGSIEEGAFYPGQLFLMTESPRWGNPRTGAYSTPADLDDPAGVVDSWVGYIPDAAITSARGVRQTTLTIESPILLANRVRIEKQYIQEKKTPKDWSQVAPLLSNPIGVFYYLCAHHAPWLMDAHDVQYDPYIKNLTRQIHNLNRSESLGGQLEQLSAYLSGQGNIGSDCAGTTWILRHPRYFSNSARNNLSTQWTWAAKHLRGELRATYRYFPQTGKTYVGAFARSSKGTTLAFRSLAPGYVASQAPGEFHLEDTTVVPTDGQLQTNEIAGMEHAYQNRRTEFGEWTVNGNLDVAEPCRLDRWHIWNIPAYHDPFGIGWSNQRILPLRVTRRWSGPRTERKVIVVEPEPETFGYPGITLPINQGGALAWTNNKVPSYFDPYLPKPPDLGIDLAAMAAWNEFTLYGRSFNFGKPLTAWRFLRGLVVDAVRNPDAAYFSDPADPLDVFVLAYDDDAGTLTLYSQDDLFAEEPVFTTLETWADVDVNDTFQYHARVLADPAETDYLVVAWKNRNGITVDRSTDGGANWAGATTYGPPDPVSNGDTATLDEPLAIDLYNQRLVFAAPHNSMVSEDADGDTIWYLYTASTKAGSITRIDNPTDWAVQQGSLAVVSASSVIVPLFKKDAPAPAEALDTVDFDSGYSGYTVSGGGSSSGTASSGFYPVQNNMAFGSTSGGFGQTAFCNVTVNLGAYYSFSELTFWRALSNGISGVSGRRWYYVVTLLDIDDQVLRQYAAARDSSSFTPDSFTVTAAQLGVQADDRVYKVRIAVVDEWDSDSGSGTALVYVDDIDITATLIDFDTERALFTLVPGTSTYTQRNSFQKLPFDTYGLAVDSGTRTNVSALVTDEDGKLPVLIQSSNGGQTWQKVRGAGGLLGLKRSGNTLLLWGVGRLELSNDAGETSFNFLGDWVGRVGPSGVFRGMTGVL